MELSTAEENEVQERLEEKFRLEAEEKLDPRWVEFVADRDPIEVADILSKLLYGTHDICARAERDARRICVDYVQHRVANYDPQEREEIIERMTAAEEEC